RSRRERSSTRWSNTVGASFAMSSAPVIVLAGIVHFRASLAWREALAQLGLGFAHRRAGVLEAALQILRGEVAFKLGAHRMPLRAGAPDPQAGKARGARQALGAEHQQGDHRDQQQFGEADV